MRNDLTDITLVLDRSGSMGSIRGDTIGSVNTFVKDQQAVPGAALYTLVQFNTAYDFVHRGIPLKEVPPLTEATYVPRDGTALLDAMGRAMNETGARLAAMPEADRPGKVVFVVMTDGLENASQEYTRERVRAMILEQQEKYAWEFVFLGANQDAIAEGKAMGIKADNAINFAANARGTEAVLASTGANLRSYREGRSANLAYSAGDRDKQRDAGAQW